MVAKHYGRFLPQDKAALVVQILNKVWAVALRATKKGAIHQRGGAISLPYLAPRGVRSKTPTLNAQVAGDQTDPDPTTAFRTAIARWLRPSSRSAVRKKRMRDAPGSTPDCMIGGA